MCDVTIYSLHAEGRAGSWNSRLPCGPVGAVACDTPTFGGTMADGQADGYKDRQFDYWYGSLPICNMPHEDVNITTKIVSHSYTP